MKAREKARTAWGARIEQVLDGRSLVWLAGQSGIDKRTLGDIVSRSMPGADKAIRIANALQCSVEWLIMGESADPRTSIAAAGRQALAELGSGPASAAQQPSAYDRALDAIATAESRSGFIPPQGLRIALASILIHHRISLDELTLLFQALRQE